MNNDSKLPCPACPVFALVGWLALTFCAALTGLVIATDGWYADLVKPGWNPPNWVFAPVWTLLYVLMAVAAWLVWRHGGWAAQRRPLTLYLLQWLLNALWTPLFFGLQSPGLALAAILALWIAVLATLRAFWGVSRTAGYLLLPYAAWVGFATLLNAAIWMLNLHRP